MDHIEEIKQKHLELQQKELEAALQHQQLLDRIKANSSEREKVRSRCKSFSSLPTDININTDDKCYNVELFDDTKLENESSFNINTKPNTNMNITNTETIKSRPKWSLTQEQNDIVIDSEVDELLHFVNSLEIDDYLEDMELQQKLTSIQSRIEIFKKKQKELESIKLKIEKDIIVTENNESNKENDANIPNLNHSTINKPQKDIKDTINTTQTEEISKSKIAQQILNSSENMKNIHSKQSITSIIDITSKNQQILKSVKMSKKDTTQSIDAEPECIELEITKNAYNEPRICNIRDRLPPVRERQNLNGNDINNLPYLYRHPGV